MKSRSTTSDTARLTLALEANGPMSARALMHTLGVSQATLSRRIAGLGVKVERIGASVRTLYALRRDVRNLGYRWPIYRIDPRGQAGPWAELRALHRGFRLEFVGGDPAWLREGFSSGLFSGLPFFLQDLRPEGYLGRAIARAAAPVLGVPDDPRNWSDDDFLAFLLHEGSDLPGNLIVGDRALDRALRSLGEVAEKALAAESRPALYPDRARAAQRGDVAGSSAGGEQPKFLATVRRSNGQVQPVMVKFTAAAASSASLRWRDLLMCEHLAAEVIARHGIPAVRSEVFDAEGRRFLELERFDRVAGGGRHGVVSLAALEDALVESAGTDGTWRAAADHLESAGLLDPAQARELRWRWCFGDLIGNTDMHHRNVSVWFGDSVPFGLTPAYDMLPMCFAPGAQGELVEREFSPHPPLPGILDVWREAAAAAAEFWSAVIDDQRLSPEFRVVASRCAAVVERIRARFA